MYFYFHNISLQNRVIFCVFQRNRGESVASAKRKLCARGGSLKRFFSTPPLARNLCFAHALHSPLLSRNTGSQKITPVLQAIVTLNQRNLILFLILQLGSFDLNCTRFYSAEVVSALEHLHGLGIIHRYRQCQCLSLNIVGQIKGEGAGGCTLPSPLR